MTLTVVTETEPEGNDARRPGGATGFAGEAFSDSKVQTITFVFKYTRITVPVFIPGYPMFIGSIHFP